MAQLLAPQSLETLDTWGSIDALDAFGTLEALDSIELFETTASVDIAITQVAVAGEIFTTSGSASISISSTAIANKLFDTDNALNTSFTVQVVDSGGNKFEINGSVAPTLTLLRGVTYTFDQSHNTNNNHPLAFKDGSGNSYTTGVTVNGTAGQANANVVFAVPSDAPSSLRYYCTVHGNAMGNTISISDDTASATLRINVTGASYERLRTVASAVDVGIVSQGGLVGYQLGGTASVTISFVKSATIEAIEHVVGSASIAITQTATPYRIQHIDAIYFADELKILIQIFPICTPNYTAVFASNESISVTNQAEFFVTYAFDAIPQIQITNSLTGEILGERWIPVSNSTNNVWHIR